MQSFMLGVKGIQGQQLVRKFGAFEQLAHGNDFALVLLQGDGGMDALTGLADGAGHSQTATAPQMFAINGDEPIRIRASCWSCHCSSKASNRPGSTAASAR